MMFGLLQHALVTAIALAAFGVLIRRIVGVKPPTRGAPECGSCPLAARTERRR